MSPRARAVVRELEAKDFARWREAYLTMLPSQSPFDRTPPPGQIPTQDQFRRILSHHLNQAALGACFEYAVFDLDTGELVGATDLKVLPPPRTALLGYSIFNRHWGRGLGTAAVRHTIEIAFGERRFEVLKVEIESGNERSLRLATACGFLPETENGGRSTFRLTRPVSDTHSSPRRAR